METTALVDPVTDETGPPFELLRRTGTLELDGPPALLRSNSQRGVKRLPIRWAGPAR